jgi:fatty-acyl-CoA synthase
MKGYWGDEEETARAIDENGWMHTGDIGIMDEQGYLNIIGRNKDMINRGGENVFPKEIEEFLLTHEEIENVQVFPIEDERLGEEIFCWVKKTPESQLTKEDIFSHCKANIAHYKVPKYVKFVEDFPITVTGKPQKFKMQESMH